MHSIRDGRGSPRPARCTERKQSLAVPGQRPPLAGLPARHGGRVDTEDRGGGLLGEPQADRHLPEAVAAVQGQ